MTLSLADFDIYIQGSEAHDVLTGTDAGDLLFGGAGNNTLSGSGDDVLFAHEGQDHLRGGKSADIFVFTADGEEDRILGFQKGQDKIYLGDWGRLYDYSELTITTHNQGARIRWQDGEIQIVNAEGRQIELSEWDATIFCFDRANSKSNTSDPI